MMAAHNNLSQQVTTSRPANIIQNEVSLNIKPRRREPEESDDGSCGTVASCSLNAIHVTPCEKAKMDQQYHRASDDTSHSVSDNFVHKPLDVKSKVPPTLNKSHLEHHHEVRSSSRFPCTETSTSSAKATSFTDCKKSNNQLGFDNKSSKDILDSNSCLTSKPSHRTSCGIDSNDDVVCVSIIPDDPCSNTQQHSRTASITGTISEEKNIGTERLPNLTAPCQVIETCIQIGQDEISSNQARDSHHQEHIKELGEDPICKRSVKCVAKISTEIDHFTAFSHYQAKILSPSAKKFICSHMNMGETVGFSVAGYQKNWEGMAECMNMDVQYTFSLERSRDPTKEILQDFQTMDGSTIGRLIEIFKLLDRFDILRDPKFKGLIERSVNNYNDAQEADKQHEAEPRALENQSPTKLMHPSTDVQQHGDTQKMFDAFVCFASEDIETVDVEMIPILEGKMNLKLCLPERDLRLGSNKRFVTTEMVTRRCRKTVLLLSRNFCREGNASLDLAADISLSLDPGCRKCKIIPVKLDDCRVPSCLNNIFPIDLTSRTERQAHWERVGNAIKSSKDKLTEAIADALLSSTDGEPTSRKTYINLLKTVEQPKRKEENNVCDKPKKKVQSSMKRFGSIFKCKK